MKFHALLFPLKHEQISKRSQYDWKRYHFAPMVKWVYFNKQLKYF